MKKIPLIFLFLLLPYDSFAQLDVYLSSQNLPYGKDVWTSSNSPDSGSSELQIERYFSREEYSPEYQKSAGEIISLVDSLFPSLTASEKQARYNSLMDFDMQDFSQYIGISISPDTQSNISDKQANGFVLTPFESVFQSCSIDLSARQLVAKNLIEDIHNGVYTDIDTLEYSDIRYGDCIIPFPDARRRSTSITDSFPSNKLIAASLGGSPLLFGALEDSVNLFSLANVVLDGLYDGVQENNLLDLQSTRVEQDTSFEKKVGTSKILYVHQNYFKNIFKDAFITGDDISGYTVGGAGYDIAHPLAIQSSDSETKRTLSGWEEVREGIYSKTLIQEDTFDIVAGGYAPKQSVGVTTYYAIIYNYDTSIPECPVTLFSHENAGNENFLLPENPWFGSTKYGYFVCSDDESGCFCDSSSIGCFLRDDRILSIPQEIPYNATFQYRFWNNAGLTVECSSPVDQKIFYDEISPDIYFTLSGVSEASLIKEYVTNAGVVYDGVEVSGKRLYHITNELIFPADDNLDIQLELYDAYDITKTRQGVSGLDSYSLSISKFEDNNWVKKIEEEFTFENYNPLGTVQVQDSYTIDFQTLENIQDIITQVGKYQVYVYFDDAAGNESRVILYFDIIAGDIDVATSTLDILDRNTHYADNSDFYGYSLTLKDEYFNPVSGKTISSIQHSCLSVPDCSELKLDMSGVTPIGEQALSIYDIDPISDVNGILNFSVGSLAPGVFTESFLMDIGSPSISLLFSGEDNTFLSPFIGTLESRVSGDWVSDILPINQLADYRIYIDDTRALGSIWNLSDFSTGQLQGRHPDTSFTLFPTLFNGVNGVYFSGTFGSSLPEEEKHKTLLEIIEGTISGVIMSYQLDGKIVQYRLSGDENGGEILQLGNTGELENPVKIIGSLQGVGNTHNISERQNTTDLDTYIFRHILRKNVGANIGLRKNDTIMRGVKYIDKTLDFNKEYVLESNPDFETLVVRNGNILIGDDFNVSGNLVGIVSYIDGGYNKETGFETIGNIYIEPEVTSIKAIMYADGGIISTQSGNPISGDVMVRNTTLQNQLTIVGSLFTRNTLAGGRELLGDYMLPGGEVSDQQALAAQYDLYYTRRGNQGCEQDAYGFCNTHEYLIIEYDPRVMSTPPKFFEVK